MKEEAAIKTIPFGKPIIGEEEKNAVWAVMESGLLVHGPVINRFEEDFAAFTAWGSCGWRVGSPPRKMTLGCAHLWAKRVNQASIS